MGCPRSSFWAFWILASATCFPAAAQSVISTHSGVVYFFEGSVFLGDQRLEQSFGRFPDIGDGGELRTERGRAEVLLVPGTFLRIGDNSAIRLLSSSLSDTRVELLSGSAVLEAREPANTPPRLIYKGWQVRLPHQGIYRIDSEPPQLIVHKGEAEVSAEGNATPVAVKEGEVLPLQAVLLTESSTVTDSDALDRWAMGRSQAIFADNATAAGIYDDPTLADPYGVDPYGLALGGFSRFPPTGVPALGLGNPYGYSALGLGNPYGLSFYPYGLSFWSPFQSSLMLYVPMYQYAPLYPGLGGLRNSTLPRSGITFPSRTWPSTTITSPRVPYNPPVRTPPRTVVPPHIGARVGGRR
jgi:FecR protein